MHTEYWSYLLTAVGIVGIWISGKKNKAGWLVGLGAQALWVWYGLATAQYGFLLSAAVYGFVYARNFVRWAKEDAAKA